MTQPYQTLACRSKQNSNSVFLNAKTASDASLVQLNARSKRHAEYVLFDVVCKGARESWSAVMTVRTEQS